MISKDTVIYVRKKDSSEDSLQKLGKGFSSKEEIENEIQSQFKFSSGESYEYGHYSDFNQLGETSIPVPLSVEETMSSDQYSLLEQIISNANTHPSVEKASKVINSKYPTEATLYEQTIRYDNHEPDISITFRNDQFEEVPVSTIDSAIEKQLKGKFDEIVDTESVVFLGYASGYAQRGRQDPYVVAYGRLIRETDTEQELFKLYADKSICGIYWTDKNISPIPIYYSNSSETEEYLNQEYIIILDLQSETDSYDDLPETVYEKATSEAERIEEEYNFQVEWIGKTPFKRNYDQIALGISSVTSDS